MHAFCSAITPSGKRSKHASSPILFASCSCSVESANLVSDSVFSDSQSGVGRRTCSQNGNECDKEKLSISFSQLACCSVGSNLVVIGDALGDVVVQIDVVRT